MKNFKFLNLIIFVHFCFSFSMSENEQKTLSSSPLNRKRGKEEYIESVFGTGISREITEISDEDQSETTSETDVDDLASLADIEDNVSLCYQEDEAEVGSPRPLIINKDLKESVEVLSEKEETSKDIKQSFLFYLSCIFCGADSKKRE